MLGGKSDAGLREIDPGSTSLAGRRLDQPGPLELGEIPAIFRRATYIPTHQRRTGPIPGVLGVGKEQLQGTFSDVGHAGNDT